MRHPQWESRLHAFVAANIDTPHSYETGFDCLLGLAAGAAKAVTGKDFARGHRRKYKSIASAYAYLKRRFGVDSPEELLDRLFPEKKAGFAAAGDLVLCRLDAGEGETGIIAGNAPGVVVAPGDVALVAGEDGLKRVPRGERWLKAWAVGDHHSGEVAHP